MMLRGYDLLDTVRDTMVEAIQSSSRWDNNVTLQIDDFGIEHYIAYSAQHDSARSCYIGQDMLPTWEVAVGLDHRDDSLLHIRARTAFFGVNPKSIRFDLILDGTSSLEVIRQLLGGNFMQ